MNRRIKRIIIAAAVVVICFGCYVTVDCIRLRNAEMGTKPLITVSENVSDTRTTYYGLGYYVQYDTDAEESQEGNMTYIATAGYGAEFRLFHKILIWAWAE